MAEVQNAGSAPQVQVSGLMSIGEVAAQNIVKALSLPETAVKTVEGAIRDEIQAMSSHFTMAVADVHTDFEVQLAKIKADFVWLKANRVKVASAAAALLTVGALIGHFV